MSKVLVADGCWEWQGSRDDKGYGRTWWDGSTKLAHRVIFEMHRGPVPDGLELDHLCRNTGCVNPDHLEPVTHAENCRRSPLIMAERTTCKRGHVLDYIGPDGRRGCRTCRYESVKRWRKRVEPGRGGERLIVFRAKDFAERHGTPVDEPEDA